MKKTLISGLMLLCICLLTSWGYKGHQAVATIAENHLTPAAKAAIKDLLKNQSLADIATWADEVRNEPAFKNTAGWHFVDLPSGLSFEQFNTEIKSQGEDNVYGAMQKARIVLTHPQSTKAQKIEALKFLVHFVGDAHQPMHVSHKEDKGGNTIQIRFDNQGANLHSLWDSKLIDHQGLTVAEMSKQYDKATTGEIKKWQTDQPMQWLWESYQISSQLYNEVDKEKNLGDDYYNSHIQIVEQRIDQAGIRLAGVLNDIYSGKLFSYTFAAPQLPEGDNSVAVDKSVSGPAKIIEAKDAANHINENVIVTSKVFGTKDVGSMILVNVGAPYPDAPLTIVLRNEAKALASQVDQKTITVTGKVVDYKGKPEIIVTHSSQVKM